MPGARLATRYSRQCVAGPGLILVIGPAGMGKSLLLQDLARVLGAGGANVLLQGRGDLPLESSIEWIDGKLTDGEASRRRVVLIDEAERLNEAMLDRLGRLGACTIVLARTTSPGDVDEQTAAATSVRLAALERDEVGPFLAARLAAAGLDAGSLSDGAVTRLAERSGGVPRMLNMLAAAALFLARSAGAARAEAEHVDQAAALRDGGTEINAAERLESTIESASSGVQAAPLTHAAGVPARISARRPSRRAARTALGVALGVAAGIAAACGWLVLDHGERARPPKAVVTAAVAPRVANSVQPEPRGLPRSPPVPAPPVPAPPGPDAPQAGGATTEPDAVAPAAVAAVPAPPVQVREPEAVPAAPDREDLPSGAPALVLLRYPRGNAGAAERAASIANALRAAGLAVNPLAVTPRRDNKPGARYFFAEDQDAAAAALRAAGLPGKATLADAARLEAPPRPGTVELILPPSQVEAVGRGEPSSPGRS